MSKKQITAADKIAASWSDKSVRKARLTRNGVIVGNQEFKSLAAFLAHEQIALRGFHTFRKALKASGVQKIEAANGKRYTIKLAEAA